LATFGAWRKCAWPPIKPAVFPLVKHLFAFST
jgi:hypothetical protein